MLRRARGRAACGEPIDGRRRIDGNWRILASFRRRRRNRPPTALAIWPIGRSMRRGGGGELAGQRRLKWEARARAQAQQTAERRAISRDGNRAARACGCGCTALRPRRSPLAHDRPLCCAALSRDSRLHPPTAAVCARAWRVSLSSLPLACAPASPDELRQSDMCASVTREPPSSTPKICICVSAK